MIRIVIADDHKIVIEGLRCLLASQDGFELIGTAGTVDSAVEAAVSLNPDVILVDLNLGRESGLDAARQIAEHAPSVATIAFTAHSGESSRRASREAGMSGYLLKDAPPDEILQTISSVASSLSDEVEIDLNHSEGDEPTSREREILRLVANGHNNREIAKALEIAEKTVQKHLTQAYKKIGVDNRTSAAMWAKTNSHVLT